MIQVVEGWIGGGKTYFAVLEAIKHVASGGTVYSNIEFIHTGLRRYIAAKYGIKYEPGQINELRKTDGLTKWYKDIGWGTLECPVLVIIDETHLWYDSHDWAETRKNHKDMLSFLSQSRKAGVDLIFITQVKTNLDKQFREQAQIYWRAVNFKDLKLPIIGNMFGSLFCWVAKETKSGTRLERRFAYFKPSIGACYKTEAMLDSMMQGMDQAKKARIAKRQVNKIGFFKRLVAIIEIEMPFLINKKQESHYESIFNLTGF